MATKSGILIALLLVFFTGHSFAQDTLISATNYKYKFGAKLISERSGNLNDNKKTFPVGCFGFQVVRKIRNSKSAFESGIYLNTKAREYSIAFYDPLAVFPYYSIYTYDVYYYYLSIPVNFRVETRSIYFSIGAFADYLITRTTDVEQSISSDKYYGTDRKFLIGYNLNLGIEKAVTYRMNIFAEARSAVTVSSAKINDGGFILNAGNLGNSNINYGFALGVNYKLPGKSN
jgi:hypothetical protein